MRAGWCVSIVSVSAWTFYWIGLYDDPHSYEELFWPMVTEGIFLGSFFTPVTVLTLHGLSGPLMTRARRWANRLGKPRAHSVSRSRASSCSDGFISHQLHLADHFGAGRSRFCTTRWVNWQRNSKRQDCLLASAGRWAW